MTLRVASSTARSMGARERRHARRGVGDDAELSQLRQSALADAEQAAQDVVVRLPEGGRRPTDARALEPVGPADDGTHAAAAADVDGLVEAARAQVLAREQVARVEHRAGRDARGLQLGGRVGGVAARAPRRRRRAIGVRAAGGPNIARSNASADGKLTASQRSSPAAGDEPAGERAEVLVAAPRELLAVRLQVQHGLGHDDDAELVHAEIDVLPLAGPLAVHERREQRDQATPAGDEVGVGLADLRGPVRRGSR